MRIVMPSRFLDRHVGGNTTYARHIAKGLQDRGVAVGRIPAGRNPISSIFRETVAGAKRGTPGDLLHYVGDTGPLFRTRRPSVVSVHGVASRWISAARNPLQERTWRARVARAIASTDEVITVSNSSANDVAHVFGVDRKKMTVIEHGIDLERFTNPTELSTEVARNLPAEFALYLGNIEPRKNLVQLVEAFDMPEVKALGLPLVIAGKPAWNSDESLRAIEASSNVIRLGFVSDDDRTALMQKARVFAFPSLYEGFGFPVLEALAAGTVVVTSNRGSLEEVAGPSLRFQDLTVDAIAAGVVDAASNEDLRIACLEAGRSWASRFTWDASVEKHLEVYRRVLGS